MTGRKTLLVGAHTGGIGDEFGEIWQEHVEAEGGGWGVNEDLFFAPILEELDVTMIGNINSYLKRHGPFKEIVYCAGINNLARVEDLDWLRLNHTFQVNTFGFALLLGHHLRLFPEARGRAALVVSDAAHTPMRNSFAYCTSKAAAEMGVRVLARELFPRWTVVGVNPGVVGDTAMTESVDAKVRDLRGWTKEEADEYEAKTSVLGRRVTKREVAETLWFAVSGPEALNGSIITVNGGK
jgi:NAD(P)-dependent dehydrogenase (short-subunit alcohol dehydrogenase family)